MHWHLLFHQHWIHQPIQHWIVCKNEDILSAQHCHGCDSMSVHTECRIIHLKASAVLRLGVYGYTASSRVTSLLPSVSSSHTSCALTRTWGIFILKWCFSVKSSAKVNQEEGNKSNRVDAQRLMTEQPVSCQDGSPFSRNYPRSFWSSSGHTWSQIQVFHKSLRPLIRPCMIQRRLYRGQQQICISVVSQTFS